MQFKTNHASVIEEEILKTLLYSDIFDYPLTKEEILTFSKLKKFQIDVALTTLIETGQINTKQGYYFLDGRKNIVTIRKKRKVYSSLLWNQVAWTTFLLSKLPFIRMLTITGSLAVNNARSKNDDIDLFIVTKKNRLWISRILVVLFMLFAKKKNVFLCPNYLITEDEKNLEISSKNIYTARELVNMVPVFNHKLYLEFMRKNNWISEFFPNFDSQTKIIPKKTPTHPSRFIFLLKRVGEKILGLSIFNALDSFEMHRTSKKLQNISSANAENHFSKNCCKSHLNGHGNRIKKALVLKMKKQKFFTP